MLRWEWGGRRCRTTTPSSGEQPTNQASNPGRHTDRLSRTAQAKPSKLLLLLRLLALLRDSTGVSPFARNDVLDPPAGSPYSVGRVSVYDSFIEPIREDKSRQLEIVTNAHVHNIIFEGTKAVGVMVSYVLQPANRQSVCLVLSKQSVCFEICTGCGWLALPNRLVQ